LDAGTPVAETIKGLMSVMPVGSRHVTMISPEAAEEMAKAPADRNQAKMDGGIMEFKDGPYLSDEKWGTVPAELAMQYNTSPMNRK